MNADINDSRETSSNSVGSFAQVIALTRLLDILQHQGPVDHFHVGLNLGVQVSVVLGFVS